MDTHIQEVIENIYSKHKDLNEGEIATYIPELGKAMGSTSASAW